ncbi:MAG: glycerol-3-phosphate 1-O-acyltransferase PlsY [Bacillota bacterium]|nr:glycerol-3-phosphate 1-O-acyltransferase PlsY [Bacillota bacterium]
MEILILITAYLIGSIPFGYIMTKLLLRTDIRKHGSGNIGATNVLRIMGWKVALPVLLLDVAKGLLAVILARTVTDLSVLWLAAGLLAMIGHSFPVFLSFRGGKAAATGIGVVAALSGWVTLILLVVAILVMFITRYVSLGSIIGALTVPILFWLFGYDGNYIIFGICMALLVIARHHQNIGRLLRGTESKFGQKAAVRH